MTLIIIAVLNGKTRTGTINDIAKMNLERNVDIVDSQISVAVCLFSDSSEM